MAKVLTATSCATASIYSTLTGGIIRAISNFSDNVRILRAHTFEE